MLIYADSLPLLLVSFLREPEYSSLTAIKGFVGDQIDCALEWGEGKPKDLVKLLVIVAGGCALH
jgi:hypothetical protein